MGDQERRCGAGEAVDCKSFSLQKSLSSFSQNASNVNNVLEGKASMGRTALHYAADFGHIDIVAYLVNESFKRFCTGISRCYLSASESLFKFPLNSSLCNADVNAKDAHGITPLLAAVFEGHMNIVRLLLQNVCSLHFLSTNKICTGRQERRACTKRLHLRRLC